jgi:N utilization substance protein B
VVGARRAARRLALDALYEAEIRDMLPLEAFQERRSASWSTNSEDGGEGLEEPSAEALGYARGLVEGVQAHQAELDELIASYADRWALGRMPVIDRNLLRIGLFELLWGEDIPVAVAINEAVELAKSLSTDDSGRFINGLLGRIAEDRCAG